MPSPSFILLRTQSDDRLVALARGGHERAFEAIVERYRRPLLHAARRVLPETRAEDALQQALVAAWTALQRGDEVRDLRAWLYRIVHNTALNALRVSGYDYVQLDDTLRLTDAGAGDDELERRAVMRQTLASLAALPARQREALLRTAVSGFSQEEVARDLGISDNAMRQLIHRARVSVRAAATSLTPLPLVTAAASGARGGPLVDRIAELAAGAAPAGASITLAKTGAAVVLAGGVLTGPALVDRVEHRPHHTANAAAAATVTPSSRRAHPATSSGGATATAVRIAAPARHAARPTPSRRVARPRKLEHRSVPVSDDRPSDRHSGSADEHPSGEEIPTLSDDSGSGDGGLDSTDHSGSGGGSSDDVGSRPVSPGDTPVDDGSHHGGSSGSGEDLAAPAPVATPAAPEPTDSHLSGHGSDDGPNGE
jgi:RNA polymerase sigma factor (sigma-70 family)